MGLSAKYTCSACGYATPELLVGSGEIACFTLVCCRYCKTLRVADDAQLARGCTRHALAFVRYGEDDAPPCPKCDAVMTCVAIGIWD